MSNSMINLNEKFKTRFPFAYNYFSTCLNLTINKEKKFPQALIFEGADTTGQYLFALELARILNCKEDGNTSCNCTNCKWIRNFSHPDISNVSQIHFKPEGDETKTVISVKQAREIEKKLALSSDFHRFFIFFSSKEQEPTEKLIDELEEFNFSSNIDFSIEPLNYQTFHTTTPNALLKSIEEPPENTTFVFLTKSKEDILPTIVSRCLVFKLSGQVQKTDCSRISSLIPDYLNLNYLNALDVSSNILDYIKEQDVSLEQILNEFLEYLKELLKQNINNEPLVLKIKNDIKHINKAIKQTRALISDKNVIENLFLRISRGY